MARNRKTDKYRLIEKRGTGNFEDYSPWLKVHEFGSCGRVHRIIGWKNRRIHQLMSDLELYFFLLQQWEDDVIDIKEQYPLPIEQTLAIAQQLEFAHPPKNRKEKTVVTTDFLVMQKKENKIYTIARAIKTQEDLNNPRTIEKLSIEKEYWKSREVEWGISTEESISKTKAINIYSIYNDYFWNEESGLSSKEINSFILTFKEILIEKHCNVLSSIKDFELINSWKIGEGIRFFKYLLAIKEIKTDMNVKLNFSRIEVWF